MKSVFDPPGLLLLRGHYTGGVMAFGYTDRKERISRRLTRNSISSLAVASLVPLPHATQRCALAGARQVDFAYGTVRRVSSSTAVYAISNTPRSLYSRARTNATQRTVAPHSSVRSHFWFRSMKALSTALSPWGLGSGCTTRLLASVDTGGTLDTMRTGCLRRSLHYAVST